MHNQKSYTPLDLNDYLDYLPRHHSRGYHECPACNGKLGISRGNGEKFTCYGGCSHSDIRKAILDLAGENTQSEEWEAARAVRATRADEKLAAETARIARLKKSDERDRDWQSIIENTSLSDVHRQDMLDRGYTPAQIDLSNARSTARHGGGRIIPITDYEGRMVGSQVILGKGLAKPWYGESGTNQLQETGELPLTVIYPERPRQGTEKDRATGEIKKVGYIAYTESTGDKPFLCANLHKYVTIGSSNIGSQPNDLKRTIEGIKTKFGWDKIHHILMADAGSLLNDHVISNYRKLNEQIAALGELLDVGWWGQYIKLIGDIDEITEETPHRYVPFDRFEKMGEDRKLYNELSKLNIEPTTTVTERFLPKIALKPNTILFIDSPCGTGKTEQLKPAIEPWITQYPHARVIDVTHLNSIKSGHQQRLDIPEYRVGHGQNDAAINGLSKISICVDSLLKLQLENIPPNSLLILDELEAILKHAAQGDTLGDKAANLQAHLVAIADRILATGGAVIGAEDSLTDISVKGLLDLTGNRYKYELVKNEYQPFKWEVAIGNGSNSDFIGSIIGKLKGGQKIFFPTSSQNYGEALERIVNNYCPELADKIYRVDSKTSPELQQLFTDPNQWLAERDVRLFIGSSTIQSGFNSSNKDRFDRVMARFANLDTRSHIQHLHRDRSDVPRDIFVSSRGAELSNRRNPVKILRSRQLVANQTSLAAGNGRINNNRIGEIWNRLDAEFSARAALSAAYLEDYLRCDLAKRGHKISPAKWESEYPDMTNQFKEIRQNIRVEENRLVFEADGHALSPIQAQSILHSSNIRFEVRQQARKTILHHDLPAADLTEEFLMKAVTEGRGAYLRACKLSFFLDKPALAKFLDKEKFTAQLAQPHIMYSRVPKLSQKIDILAPIRHNIDDLASGREFKDDDPAVLAIQAHALKHKIPIWHLFNLTIEAEGIRSDGKRKNAAIATVSKLFERLGYDVDQHRKKGSRKNQVKFYQIKVSPHRDTIHQALELKYKDYLVSQNPVSTDSNLDPLVERVDTGNGGVDPPFPRVPDVPKNNLPPSPALPFHENDRVVYVGMNKTLQKQYHGILKVRTVKLGVYSCYTACGTGVTSWIDFDDLQLVG
jgi:hypothetical protein